MSISTRDQQIIDGLNAGKTGSELAREFGISPSRVSEIKKKYSYLLGVAPAKPAASTSKPVEKLAKPTETKEAVREAVEFKEPVNISRTINVLAQTGRVVSFTSSAQNVSQLLKEVKGNVNLDGLDVYISNNNTRLSEVDLSPLPADSTIFIISVPVKVKAG
jgi:hypothetical protein